MQKWLDLSFSPVSVDWCKKRLAEGWDGLIQNLWTGRSSPAVAYDNLRNAGIAGMLTAGYTVVNAYSGEFAVETAKASARDAWEYLSFLAIDVEVKTTSRAIRQAITRGRELGKNVILYSARWVYESGLVSGEWAFSDVPLWIAQYDGDDRLETARPLPGWSKVTGKQYAGTTPMDGAEVDLNVFEEEDMTPEQDERLKRVEAMLQQILGPGDNWIVDQVGLNLVRAFQAAAQAVVVPVEPEVK